MSWRPIGSRTSGVNQGLRFYVELVLFPISFVFILLCAAAVRVLGTDLTYKLFFVALAFVIVLKTIRGG